MTKIKSLTLSLFDSIDEAKRSLEEVKKNLETAKAKLNNLELKLKEAQDMWCSERFNIQTLKALSILRESDELEELSKKLEDIVNNHKYSKSF